MVNLNESHEPEREEKRTLLYFLGVSLSYIAMVGGLLVFILLILEVDRQVLGGLLSVYLSTALAVLMTFFHRPIQDFGLRKFFGAGSTFFLILSLILLLDYLAF